MSEIKITLPDNSVRTYESGVTAIDIANSIGPRLAKETIAVSINNNLVDFEGTEIKISSSGGVAFSTETETSADLTNKADERLYEAKKNGRNRFTLHDSELVGE
mgnify:CR=1 FL=1